MLSPDIDIKQLSIQLLVLVDRFLLIIVDLSEKLDLFCTGHVTSSAARQLFYDNTITDNY
jgi:hypothetical protein